MGRIASGPSSWRSHDRRWNNEFVAFESSRPGKNYREETWGDTTAHFSCGEVLPFSFAAMRASNDIPLGGLTATFAPLFTLSYSLCLVLRLSLLTTILYTNKLPELQVNPFVSFPTRICEVCPVRIRCLNWCNFRNLQECMLMPKLSGFWRCMDAWLTQRTLFSPEKITFATSTVALNLVICLTEISLQWASTSVGRHCTSFFALEAHVIRWIFPQRYELPSNCLYR